MTLCDFLSIRRRAQDAIESLAAAHLTGLDELRRGGPALARAVCAAHLAPITACRARFEAAMDEYEAAVRDEPFWALVEAERLP